MTESEFNFDEWVGPCWAWMRKTGRQQSLRVAKARLDLVKATTMVKSNGMREHDPLGLDQALSIWHELTRTADAQIEANREPDVTCQYCRSVLLFHKASSTSCAHNATADRLVSGQGYAENARQGKLVLVCTACNFLFGSYGETERNTFLQFLRGDGSNASETHAQHGLENDSVFQSMYGGFCRLGEP